MHPEPEPDSRNVPSKALSVDSYQDNSGSPASLWEDVEEITVRSSGQRITTPDRYRTLILNKDQMRALLLTSPLEFTPDARSREVKIPLPKPDGTTAWFRIVESPIMDPDLAVKYPEFRTYAGQGIDDPTATVRFDMSPDGFHAQILSPGDRWYIEPYFHLHESDSHHISFFRKDLSNEGVAFVEQFVPNESGTSAPEQGEIASASVAQPSSQLRIHRIAIAATSGYSTLHGGTPPFSINQQYENVRQSIVRAINFISGIYEKEVGVRFIEAPNSDLLIFLNNVNRNGTPDPYIGAMTNNVLINQNQRTIDNLISNQNYDLGHLFHTFRFNDGVAGIGVVGLPGQKARAATGTTTTFSAVFWVDFVSHEIGHQYSADHTWNGQNQDCAPSDWAGQPSSVEPGSGSTIMGYAGICGSDDVQPHTDPYFHARSRSQILNWITGSNPGNISGSTTPNNVPTAAAGNDYTIPAITPFELTGQGTDSDAGDVLTYAWEQMDVGVQRALNTPWPGNGPTFRSLPPDTGNVRVFPDFEQILANDTNADSGTCPALPGGLACFSEFLPTVSGTLNFRLTVRDNHSGGGGAASDDMIVTVNNTGAPFRVTYPDTAISWNGGEQETVTWDVANTNNAPISCSNVNIRLSTDFGQTFPTQLAGNSPNDGNEQITVPQIETSGARVRIECAGNIFFDISNRDFTIAPTCSPNPVLSADGNTCEDTSNTDPAYKYTVIAASDGSDIRNFSRTVSQNNKGTVAFIAESAVGSENWSSLRKGDGKSAATLVASSSSHRIFSFGIQINDSNQIIAHDTQPGTDTSLTHIRLWNANDGMLDVWGDVASGQYLNIGTQFDAVFSWPVVSNTHIEVYGAYNSHSFQTCPELCLIVGASPYAIEAMPRPMIADSTVTVWTQSIQNDPNLAQLIIVNDREALNDQDTRISRNFTNFGKAPGISDDAAAIVFYAVLSEFNAQQFGITPGPGIFALIETKSDYKLVRIAGLHGNGQLDPGETWTDSNSNGVVDAGEDDGLFIDFNIDTRVAVNNTDGEKQRVATVTFQADNRKGKGGLYASRIAIDYDDNRVFVLPPTAVVEMDQTLPGIGGTVEDFETYDPVNTRGQIAFWLRTSAGEFVVRAEPNIAPLIFVPGLMGSYLYDRDIDSELWPTNFQSQYGRLSLHPNDPQHNIIATDALREVNIPVSIPLFGGLWTHSETVNQSVYTSLLNSLFRRGGYLEYDVDDQPERRTSAGCDIEQADSRPSLFVFAYDWRQDIGHIAPLLADYIECIRKLYDDDTEMNVHILAHSMGGLVARRYILDKPSTQKVEKVVTIGVPWLGTPQAAYALATGNGLGPRQHYLIGFNAFRYLIQSFPGTHQLLPGPAYFDLNEGYQSPFVEAGWDINENGTSRERYDFSAFAALYDERYGADNFMPGTTTGDFHLAQTGNGQQDDWQADGPDIKYYHVIGIQPGDNTLTQIEAVAKQRCTLSGGTPHTCSTKLYLSPHYGRGDGTVPIQSATRQSYGYDLNAASANLLFVMDGSSASEHIGLTQNPHVQDYTLNKFLPFKTPSQASTPSQRAAPTPQSHYLTAYGVDMIFVTDQTGASSGIEPNAMIDDAAGASVLQLGDGALQAVLRARQEITSRGVDWVSDASWRG